MSTCTSTSSLFWRWTDVEGLERLELAIGPDGVTAASTVLGVAGDQGGGFRLDRRWRRTPD